LDELWGEIYSSAITALPPLLRLAFFYVFDFSVFMEIFPKGLRKADKSHGNLISP
jgi:hypothetical protein